MLNKVNSFLIILILLYVTFKYCDLYEGQSDTYAGRQGNTDGDDDGSVKLKECRNASGVIQNPVNTFSGGGNNTTYLSCQYRETSCLNTIRLNDVANNWNQYIDNSNDYKNNDKGSEKYNCSKCVQGSDIDGSFRYYLANVGTDINGVTKHSKFADDLCDGMAADCDDAFFYAVNKQDWSSGDCNGVEASTHGTFNYMLCGLMGNSFISFVTGFLGGITCNLKINFKNLISGLPIIGDG